MQKFTLKETGGASQNFAIVQDSLGLVYVANLMSVLEYDGVRWRSVPHPERLRPVSMDIDNTGRIFVGFQGDIGFLQEDRRGRKRIISLKSQLPENIGNIGYIWGTKSTRDGIFFRSQNILFRWKPSNPQLQTGEMKVWHFPADQKLMGLSNVNGHCLFWQKNVGILKVVEDSCAVLKGSERLKDIQTRSITWFKDNRLLLACEDNGLFIYSNNMVTSFDSEANLYAKEHFAIGITPLPNDQYALATRNGGLAIFDSEGKILYVVDKSLGLLDNNIIGSPYLDLQGGLWLPLNYGITRVEASSSISYYDFDQGVEGSVNTVLRHSGSLYIGTSQGIKVLRSASKTGEPASFKAIPEANQRCWQMVNARGKLFGATERGLEEVASPDRPSRLIYRNNMAYCLAVSRDSSHVYLGTYDQGVYAFKFVNGELKFEKNIPGTSRQILLMQVDEDGSLWLMANYRHIEKVVFSNVATSSISRIKVYDTSSGLPQNNHYYPFLLDGEFFAGNPAGLFRYDREQDFFVNDSVFGEQFESGERGMWNIVTDTQDRVWFNTQYAKGARVFPVDDGYELEYPLLRASQSNFLCFFPEEEGTVVWAGGEDGRLIRYNENNSFPDTLSFKALVRRVTVGGDSILLDGSLPRNWETPRLPHRLNSLRFEFTFPRYDAPEAKKFQYRLVGLNDEWSEWSEETYRDFNSLPAGHYSFQVRGYDIYYHESDVESFDFQVLPPFRQSVWAIILYILAGIGFIYLILKWRFRRIEYQKKQLEKTVALRTDELKEANEKIQEYSEHLEVILDERTRHLILSERQAVFGQMVQGIVHNLKNPLTSSSLNAQMIQFELQRSAMQNYKTGEEELTGLRKNISAIEDKVGGIVKANDTLNNMIVSLLTKSRSDTGENKKVINLNDLVRTELEFIQADRRYKLMENKVLDLSVHEISVKVVPGELAQVIQNLVRNALDAMHGVEQPAMYLKTEIVDSTAVFSITDNGSGIEDSIQEMIFDPFFSTKPPEGDESAESDEPKGTGLGLYMCQEAMKSFGGEIQVESEVGKGTTFKVILPIA